MKKISFNFDKKTYDLIIKCEKISFLISLIGILGLYINLKFYITPLLLEIGIILFRFGLIAGISSFCSGLFCHGVKKGLIK